MAHQPSLPLSAPPRTARHRAVAPRPEREPLYQAILALRRHGHVVYRAGADHQVDGKRLSDDQLLRLSEALGQTPACATAAITA